MGYLFCQKCGGSYKLNDGESLADFAHCSCGGNLIFTENIEGLKNLENIYDKSDESKGENNSAVMPSDFKNEKSNNKIRRSDSPKGTPNKSKQLSNIGLILMLAGLLLFIFAFFYPFLFFESVMNNPDQILVLFVHTVWIYLISIIMMVLGAFIFLFSNIAIGNTKKKSKISFIDEHLNELPGSYTIFYNVKIPKTRSVIGHVVIGANGIFIIHNRTVNGNFIIRNDEWWRLKGNKRTKAILNPGKIVKMNTIDLKRFLDSHNVNVEYAWITPIVSFPSDQYTIEETPKNYSLIPPEDVSGFIITQKRNIPHELIMRIIALLARHSN